MVQKLWPFYWRGWFCLLVELHREGSAPAASAKGFFLKDHMTHFQIMISGIHLKVMSLEKWLWVNQKSPCLYYCFLWFFIHILRQQNTKLRKRITLALANTVYIRINKMYFDCCPLSKYLPMLEDYWYLGFFQSKDVSLAFPIHFYTFLATKIVVVEVLVG